MPNALSLLSFFNKSKNLSFKYYYTNWFNTLNNNHLPLLHRSLSCPSSTTLLSSHVRLVLRHLLAYYDALDLAAIANTNNLPYLLYPSWKNSLESPFLFLGDLHPYVFTNLLRSFLNEESSNEDIESDGGSSMVSDRSWLQGMVAWKYPSKDLMIKIEEIERGLRLMVPAITDRAKKAQARFVAKVTENWVNNGGKKEKVEVAGAMKAEMEELVCVFFDANRLRRSVLSEIIGALSVYQGALYLKGLVQFLVGFKDPDLLHKFENCKTPISEQLHVAL